MECLALLDPAPAQDMASLPGQIVTGLLSGHSVLVTGDAEMTAVLAAVGNAMGRTRTRVVAVRAPLDLPSFMGQVTPAGPARGGSELEQGFTALTQPDQNFDRIALLIEEAHLMPQATLRYIELALRTGPCLQVVFAGQRAITETLSLRGYAGLRKRLTLHIEVPVWPSLFMAAPSAPVMEPVPPANPPVRHRRTARALGIAGAMAGAAMAAGVALGVWSPPHGAAPIEATIAHVEPERLGTAAMTDMASTLQPTGMVAADRLPDAAPAVAGPPLDTHEPSAGPQPAPLAAVDAIPAPEPEVLPVIAAEPPATPASPQMAVVAQPAPMLEPIPAEDPLPLPPPHVGEVQNAPAPTSSAPTPLAPAPSAIAPVALPQIPRTPARALPVRSEPAATKPTPTPDARRCRDITLRVQLGEDPSDGDRTYLRNGCR